MSFASLNVNTYRPIASHTNLKQLETKLKHFLRPNLLRASNFQFPIYPNLKHSRNSEGLPSIASLRGGRPVLQARTGPKKEMI